MKMKKILKKNRDVIIIVIYITLVLSIINFHEHWRDEAQQWFIIKNLDFMDIIKQMKYEGHSMLWYIILMPFVKLNFNIIIMNIISCCFMALAVFFILKKAPFHYFTKVLLVFSSPFLYYYSINSRVYCLIPLAEILLAMSYKDRLKKPYRYIGALVFLANTHLIMWGQVGVLFLEFVNNYFLKSKERTKKENKNVLFSILIFIFLLSISVLPLLNSWNINKDLNKIEYNLNYIILMFLMRILDQIFCFFKGFLSFYFTVLIIFVLFIFLFICFLKLYRKIWIQILLCFVWQNLIYVFVFDTNMYKSLSGICILMFYAWILKENYKMFANFNSNLNLYNKIMKIIIHLLMVLNVLSGLYMCYLEIKYEYSCSKEIATYINTNIGKDSIIISGDLPETCTPIMLYTDKVKFYSVQMNDYFSYIIWDGNLRKNIKEDFLDKIIEKFDSNDTLYYIYPKNKVFKNNDKKIVNKLKKEGKLEKVFESNEALDNEESYILYKIIK